MSDIRRTIRYLKGKQTSKEFSRCFWIQILKQGGLLNQFDNLIYAVGRSDDDTYSGIYIFDTSMNSTGEFHDLKTIYNSSSFGEIFLNTSISSPRDICIDDNGKFYIIDVGYGSRLYRLNNDLSLDETFIVNGNPYLTLGSPVDFPESVEVDSDGIIYIGDRANQVNIFQPDGTFIETKDLSAILTNNLIGGIRLLNDKFYVTDKNIIYEFDLSWVYTGGSWSTTYNVGSTVHGGNNYGLTKTLNGWILCEITYDEFNLYDNELVLVNSKPFQVVSSIRGLVHVPIIRTGVAPPVIEITTTTTTTTTTTLPPTTTTTTTVATKTYFVDFGRDNNQTVGNWNNIITVDQGLTQLIDYDGIFGSKYIQIIYPFVSIDYLGGLSFNGLPDTATGDAFVLRGYINDNSVIELSGLDQAKTYSIYLYASQNTTGAATDFWINGVKKSVITDNNDSIIITYLNIVPDVNGKIQIEVNTDTNYGYLNAMKIEEN